MPKNLRDLEAQLIALRADAHNSATTTRGDRDLTAEGKAARHAAWGAERKWGEQVDSIETSMLAALADAQVKAAELRADMTALPEDTAARTHAELRHQRRAAVVEHAIKHGGGPVAELIANALPEDVPLITETVHDHALIADSDVARDGLTNGVELGLSRRSEAYANAAKTAQMAQSAAHVVEAQVAAARAAVTNVDAPVPSEHSPAALSVDVAGTSVGDLTP